MKKRLSILSAVMVLIFMAGTCFAADVVVTAHGKKYHKPTCRIVQNKEVTTLDEKEAVEKGYEPCRRCHKDDLTADQVTDAKKQTQNQIENRK